MTAWGRIWFLGALWAYGGTFAHGLTSQQLFEQTEPSVVLIGNAEGFASGVVVSKDGKVLTNYHAILSALPLCVKAKVWNYGKWQEMTFDDVSVIGVHDKYDLALLQIKNNHVQFKPLAMLQTKLPAVGGNCFVIGNPGAGNETLRNTITGGLISSADRLVDGLSYIQISAAINPGNSGGALLTDDGKLVGIVTFKPTDTEGIGFAIPVKDIKNSSFVDPKQRVADAALAIANENKGRELFYRARQVEDPKLRTFLFALAGYYFRMSLIAAPLNFSPYHNVGLIYKSLGENKLALAYFEKALQIDPNSAGTLHMLGITQLDNGQKDEALNSWRKGAFISRDGAGPCAMNAGISFFEAENYAGAAYMARLSLVIEPDVMTDQKQTLLHNAQAKISAGLYQMIESKHDVSNFSESELGQLASNEAQSIASEKKEQALLKEQEVANRVAFEKRVQELMKRPDSMENTWIQKKAPKTITDAIPVFGGMAIALSFKELSKIGIFDPFDASINRYITTASSDFLMAAGGSRLVLYLKGLGILETYDLGTMTRIRATKLPSTVIITEMVMGLNKSDVVFVSYAEDTDSLSTRFYALLDPLTGKITPLTSSVTRFSIERPNRFWNISYRDNVHFSTDEQLTHLAGWCSSHSPSGFEYTSVDCTQASFVNQYQHESIGTIGLSPDGSYAFSSHGNLYKDGVALKPFPNTSLFPVLGANLMIELRNKKQVAVRTLPYFMDILTLELPIEFDSNKREEGTLTANRSLVASALSQRLVFIDDGPGIVYVHPLRVRTPLGNTKTGPSDVGMNSLFARPGTTWVYNLQLNSGESAKIADAPQGVELVNGALRWAVPVTAEKKPYELLVSIQSATGSEDYRVVKLLVQ